MPATLVWGKEFRLEQTALSNGESYPEAFGVDGGHLPISWASVEEMQKLCACHGIKKELWPVYEGCEVDADVPIEDAQERSAKLRSALEAIDAPEFSQSPWLTRILKLLREGKSFFIMS